jgi:hypothetical protein
VNNKKIKNFDEFYQFYLTEHTNSTNRLLHFIGTSLSILLLIYFIIIKKYLYIIGIPIIGYGFAWVGHFFFEKNKPASFNQPIYSFICDFLMWFHLLTRKIKF